MLLGGILATVFDAADMRPVLRTLQVTCRLQFCKQPQLHLQVVQPIGPLPLQLRLGPQQTRERLPCRHHSAYHSVPIGIPPIGALSRLGTPSSGALLLMGVLSAQLYGGGLMPLGTRDPVRDLLAGMEQARPPHADRAGQVPDALVILLRQQPRWRPPEHIQFALEGSQFPLGLLYLRDLPAELRGAPLMVLGELHLLSLLALQQFRGH
jgi:hypothetical protein